MTQSTYMVRKPIKIGHEVRQPGQLAPEAATWFRVDHHVHCGNLVAVAVSDEEFDAAVLELCPEAAPSLYPKEHPMQDLAAQRALERQRQMAADPQTTLQETLAAPPNNLDPSRSDQDAAAALRAAALSTEADKAVAEQQKEAAERRQQAADDAEVTPLEEIEVKGAHEKFISDNVPDEQKVEHADDEPELTQEEAEKAAAERQEAREKDAELDGRKAQNTRAATAKKQAAKKSEK